MTVREASINSVADLEALPQDEWVFVPGGIQVEFDYDGIEIEEKRLRIRLPPSLLKRFRAHGRLRARISRGVLIVEEDR